MANIREDASTGSILFGGIDTKKYIGDLTRVNILKDARIGTFTHFTVALTSIGASSPTGSDSLTSTRFPIPVVLDSGTTLSYLPADIAQQMWAEVGAIYLVHDDVNNINIDMAVIPCARANEKGNFTFGFGGPGGPEISVSMDELVLDLTDGPPIKFSAATKYRGEAMCGFGIQNFSTGPYLLGDSFLRSAYVVYDLVNNQIGLAATDFNATETNPVPFPTSGAPIPSATVAPHQDQISATGAVTSPAYAASSGFQRSESVVPGVQWSALGVILASIFITAVGSGMFVLI
jgi:Eukaryotic aspartyl protease